MIFELRFTPEAEETYKALSAQLLQRWDDKYATKFKNKVSTSLKIIQTTPYIYPVANENTGIRKCILHKNCSILYRVYDEIILIVCFWDNRQDPIFIS